MLIINFNYVFRGIFKMKFEMKFEKMDPFHFL